MVQGDPRFEIIESEIDKWRFAAMICLELQAKEPLPNLDRYWISKGFNLADRAMHLTLKALQKFIVVVTEDDFEQYVDKDKEEDEDKEKDTSKSKPYIDFSEAFYRNNVKSFPKHLKDWNNPNGRMKLVLNGAEEIRKLIDLDGYNFEEVKKVLRFAIQDDFWSKQVIRLTGLRNKSKRNGNTKFQNIAVKALDYIDEPKSYTYVCPMDSEHEKPTKTEVANLVEYCGICKKKKVKEK
jgi:hypothetical protein